MSELLRSGAVRVEYRRAYGASEYTIISPVLDVYSMAVPVRAAQSLALPGQQGEVTGIAMQSYLLVLTVEDPAEFPMVVRPWWIATDAAAVVMESTPEVHRGDRIHILNP